MMVLVRGDVTAEELFDWIPPPPSKDLRRDLCNSLRYDGETDDQSYEYDKVFLFEDVSGRFLDVEKLMKDWIQAVKLQKGLNISTVVRGTRFHRGFFPSKFHRDDKLRFLEVNVKGDVTAEEL